MSRAQRTAAWGSALAVALLLLGACSSGGSAPPTSAGIPRAPAACAGAARSGAAEVRSEQWDAARASLTANHGAEVWVGFSRVLSVAEVAKLPGSLRAHGLLLVYEQEQGTYLKALDVLPNLPLGDPAFGQRASQVLARSAATPNGLPGGAPDAFKPVDADVLAGRPPIAAVKVSGDVMTLLQDDPCLIHSMSPGTSNEPPAIPPKIEPDAPFVDRG